MSKGLPEDDRWIVNLSQSELSDDEKKVLRKGLNFALARNEVPKIEYIACVDSALRQLQDVEGANLARAKVSALLSSTKCPTKNLSAAETQAMRDLERREDIVIAPADKGNAVVVLDAEVYAEKVKDLIEKPPFVQVKRDPTKRVEDKINKHLWKLHQEGAINRRLYNELHASSCPLPRFYGTVKIHKPSQPLRPVISAIGTAMYATSKYLARVLKPLTEANEYAVKNSK